MTPARRAIDELGAHVSSAGGVRHAPARAAELRSNVLQLFTKQPSRWAEPLIDADEIEAYRDAAAHFDIRAASAHDSYLINLASHDATLHARSVAAFARELQRCAALGIPFLVSHPGNATDGDVAGGLARNAEAVQAALELCADVSVLFETTAGSGRVLGASFEQLADLLRRIPEALQHRLGVCLDTCHVWAAGYDLRDHYDDVFQHLDDSLGVESIRLFHLNDSVGSLGSRRDRHAHIGRGALGDEPFRRLLLDPRFRLVPKLIETPKDNDATVADRRNLRRLRGYRSGARTRNKSPNARKMFSLPTASAPLEKT